MPFFEDMYQCQWGFAVRSFVVWTPTHGIKRQTDWDTTATVLLSTEHFESIFISSIHFNKAIKMTKEEFFASFNKVSGW